MISCILVLTTHKPKKQTHKKFYSLTYINMHKQYIRYFFLVFSNDCLLFLTIRADIICGASNHQALEHNSGN